MNNPSFELHKMDENIRKNRILRVPLTCLSWLGLVTFSDQKYPLLNRTKGYIVIITFVLYNISEIIFLVINRENVALLTINGGTTALYFTIYVKSWASLNHRKKFCEMFATMNKKMKIIEESNDEEQKCILDGYVGRCLKVVWYLQANMTFTCTLFMVYLVVIFFIIHV